MTRLTIRREHQTACNVICGCGLSQGGFESCVRLPPRVVERSRTESWCENIEAAPNAASGKDENGTLAPRTLDELVGSLSSQAWMVALAIVGLALGGCVTSGAVSGPPRIADDLGSPLIARAPKLDLDDSGAFRFTKVQLDGPPIDDVVIVVCELSDAGHLSSCNIVKHSPHVLDAQIIDFCDRLVFEPARDAQGQPLAIRRYTLPLRVHTYHGD